jgi:hypothetical protein
MQTYSHVCNFFSPSLFALGHDLFACCNFFFGLLFYNKFFYFLFFIFFIAVKKV